MCTSLQRYIILLLSARNKALRLRTGLPKKLAIIEIVQYILVKVIMAILLELDPEIESRLIAQAAAQGTSVEVLLKTLVEGLLASSLQLTPLTLSPQERAQRFVNWARSHSSITAPPLSDDAISRESIYTIKDYSSP